MRDEQTPPDRKTIIPTGHDDVLAKHIEFTQDEFRMSEAAICFRSRGGGAQERRAHLY